MTAKEYLQPARKLLRKVRLQKALIVQAEEMATCIAPSSGGRTPNAVSDKVGNNAALVADRQTELQNAVRELITMQAERQKVISRLADDRYSELLQYYYILGYSWEQTATAMSYSEEHVRRRLHPQALAALEAELKKMTANDR